MYIYARCIDFASLSMIVLLNFELFWRCWFFLNFIP